MAVHSFSTKEYSDKEVQKLKAYCKSKHINFSAMVIKAIAKLNQELENEQQR